jgi:TRAP-type C4-dicarboxylate transport system permease small subunit
VNSEEDGTFGRLVARVEDAMTALACLAVLAMVLITAANVVFRYVLNAPFSWSQDVITSYLLIALFFLSIAYVTRTGGHMNLDFAVRRLRVPWLRNLFAAVGDGLGLLLAVGIAWGSWGAAVTAFEQHEVLPGAIALPTWPSRFMVPLGSALLALRLFCRLLAILAAARQGRIVPHAEAER